MKAKKCVHLWAVVCEDGNIYDDSGEEWYVFFHHSRAVEALAQIPELPDDRECNCGSHRITELVERAPKKRKTT